MQKHLAACPLNKTLTPDKDVWVRFATVANRRAVLFIHGYGGDPLTTWSDFQDLLPECVSCSGHDLFFYGYDGLRSELIASATIFRDFVERLFTTTSTLINTALPNAAQRDPNFEYESLTIVGHSLGAVVARRAMLDAHSQNSLWVKKTCLVLYAPAHSGARIADLAVETAVGIPFLKYFSAGARFVSPLIDQLKPDSIELRSLLADMTQACAGGANEHLIAKRVIIADRESIVINTRFAGDPLPHAIAGTTHRTVCKPRREFLEPLTHLEQCL